MPLISGGSEIVIPTMYSGQITLDGNPISIDQALALGKVYQDANGDIWLSDDVFKLVTITQDLQFNS